MVQQADGDAPLTERRHGENEHPPDHLLPQLGEAHTAWFATRMEKRGGEIKIFLDNKLAMTYIDPHPLPGGYVGIWTRDNGMAVKLVNLSAERTVLGSRLAAPHFDMPQSIPHLAMPQVQVHGVPLNIATFAHDLEGWQQSPGLTGHLTPEYSVDPRTGPHSYVKLVNSYPAGDCSAIVSAIPRTLACATLLHFDYCFDAGAQINLYLRGKPSGMRSPLPGSRRAIQASWPPALSRWWRMAHGGMPAFRWENC